MNLLKLSWTYLKHKPLNTGLNIIMLSFGIAIIVVLMLLGSQLEEKLTKNAENVDLVVGAKGSPVQLILSSIFHIDYPTGNIPLAEAYKISKIPFVKKAIPLSLGDSYATYRIVGTEHSYVQLYNAELREGKLWEDKYQVTLGSVVAEKLGYKTGDKFYGQHGMAQGGHFHEEDAYHVVGVLEKSNTVLDQLILTGLESIWGMHEFHPEENRNGNVAHQDDDPEEDHHEYDHRDEEKLSHITKVVSFGDSAPVKIPEGLEGKEITAILIQYASPMAIIQMPRLVNSKSALQAASPAFEITRLFSLLGVGLDAIKGFAWLIILISCLSIFIALYNSLKERKYDLAIMRSMGATRAKLFLHILLEGMILTTLGGVAGFLMGHGIIEIFIRLMDTKNESGITGRVFLEEELWILLLCVGAGLLSSIIPAIGAYKTDISKILAEG